MSSLKRKIKYLFKPIPDPTSGIITGEKIQLLCDHFLGDKKDSSRNPLLWRRKYKWRYFENLNRPFNNKSRIFCYTDTLWKLDLLIEKLKWMKNPFLLVFHTYDTAFTEKHLKLFDHLPNLKKIYSQNLDVDHGKVIPLPIGIANTELAHGKSFAIDRIRDQDLKKENLLYFNFSIDTNEEKRLECYQKISDKGVEFQSRIDFENYVQLLSTYKFAICPEGNGIDTYRFWECLYLRVVPICKKNFLTEYYSQYFPVILLDDWDDLDVSRLENAYSSFQWNNLEMLDMSYYDKLLTL